MRSLLAFLAVLIALPVRPVSASPAELNIVIVEGEGATNNIRQRITREPIVQVEDANHKPVAGAAVVFSLPAHGAGGTFANGAHTLTAVTDEQGRAVARGFTTNGSRGPYKMHVTASSGGQTASADIGLVNVAAAAGAGAGAGAAAGISGKLIAVIAVLGAAAAGGAVAAVKAGGGGNNSTINGGANSPTTITPGTGTVGPPH